MVNEQGTFLPLIVPPSIYQAGLWSTWLVVLCSLKVYIVLKVDVKIILLKLDIYKQNQSPLTCSDTCLTYCIDVSSFSQRSIGAAECITICYTLDISSCIFSIIIRFLGWRSLVLLIFSKTKFMFMLYYHFYYRYYNNGDSFGTLCFYVDPITVIGKF